jgi:hypothetical protein
MNATDSDQNNIVAALEALATQSPPEDRLQSVLSAVEEPKPSRGNLTHRSLGLLGFAAAASVVGAAVWMIQDKPDASTQRYVETNSAEMETLLRTSQSLELVLGELGSRRASLRQLQSFERARLPLIELDARLAEQRNPDLLRERIRVMQDVKAGRFDAAFYRVD